MAELIINGESFPLDDDAVARHVQLVITAQREAFENGSYVLTMDDKSTGDTTMFFVTPATQISIVYPSDS